LATSSLSRAYGHALTKEHPVLKSAAGVNEVRRRNRKEAAEGYIGDNILQEDTMRNAPRWIGWTLSAGVMAGAIGVGIDSSGWSRPAIAQKKSEGRQSLNVVVSSLRAVDTAYASGNAAEAQTRFSQARSAWDSIAPRISAREAREQQLLFDSLDKQLKSGVPATQVKSTISGMLDELREDIERELR
jgi:hypothetical protein